MDGIRLGTIGSGTIVRSILDAVRATPGIRLEAVYSRSPEKAERLAADYGAASVYSDMDAFLSDPAVNFVYIATPNSLHFAQAKRSLLAGKNVILEKPFCPCAEEAAELVALARENGLFLVDATPTAFLPGLGILRRELPALGRIRAVQANYSQYSSRLARLAAGFLPPVFDPAFCGGCLMDLGYYNVYLNAALFGRPRAVRYEPRFLSESFFADAGNAPDAAKRPRTADIAGTLTLDYGDFTSTNFAAKDIPGVSFFQISGERGSLYVAGGSNGLSRIFRITKEGTVELTEDGGTSAADGASPVFAEPSPERWAVEIRNLVPLLLAEDRAALDERLRVMLDTVSILEEARKSTAGAMERNP